MQPVDRGSPALGAEVAVDLNDAGRAALAPKLGPEVAQVHGHLLGRDDEGDLLAVTSAEFLRGGSQVWSGDTVRVRTDYTTRYYENRVSTKRSLVFAGVVAGALAVMTTAALHVSEPPQSGDGSIPGPGDKVRALPRAGVRFSTSTAGAERAVRFLVPFLSRR